MTNYQWKVIEPVFDPSSLAHRETVFTVGNGYACTRGAFEEGYPGEQPATLVHGLYDDVPIYETELANCPNWLALSIRVEGEPFRMDRGHVLAYERSLDLRRGVLTRAIRWRSTAGQTVDLRFQRFMSLADPHVLALCCTVTPIDWSGLIEIRTHLDGHPHNDGLLHWEALDQGGVSDTIWMALRTRTTKLQLAMAARLGVKGARRHKITLQNCPRQPMLTAVCQACRGKPLTLEKAVMVFTSRDTPDPLASSRERLASLPSFDDTRREHEQAWANVWQESDIAIEGDPEAQRAVRYNLFQSLIAAPRWDDRVSVPAKALSGFGYRGHVFWDTELFILPLFTYTQPDIARHLLDYRYHTLPGARRKAQEAGHAGAMFAWESAATGDEVTPRFVPDPDGKELVRVWTGDRELHISADVAYAVWHFWRATADHDWMGRRGCRIILETALFWESRVQYDEDEDLYHLTDVIGPDEYHECVDDNTYTNRMVQWHMDTAQRAFAWLCGYDPERANSLKDTLNLTTERLARWAHITNHMMVHSPNETGVIEQFSGFSELQDIDLERLEPRARSLQAILGIEGANQTQVLKQPDVLMLLYLLLDEYDPKTLRANWDYYAPRTDHLYGSSLAPSIHAILACALGDSHEAYEHLMRAAMVDLADRRGNTSDGIHAASAGALWQTIVFGFGGLRFGRSGPCARPCLPEAWKRLEFGLWYQGQRYCFDLTQEGARQHPQAQPRIESVIFDLDGVLTDTSEYHYRAWKQLADEERIPFGRQENEALRGVSRRESLLRLLGDRPATEAQIQEMMARKNGYYQAFLQDLTPANLLPGAIESLQQLRQAGIRLAIASASKNARTVIDRIGIADKVDAISDGHSVGRHKPEPDLFYHAAGQLSAMPEACVVVEDAASGVNAGRTAGMWTIGVGPEKRVGHADLTLSNLAAMHWTDLPDCLVREPIAMAGRNDE